PAMTAARLVDEVSLKRKPRIVPRYPINCLRHVAASLMIEDGLNPKQLQARMGHSSVKVTYDLYGHLFDEAEADNATATRIEAMLSGERPSNISRASFRRNSATPRARRRKPAEKLASDAQKFADDRTDD
ncbi:MAG TPA: tyrosine-type recombinase/integrase, partial [Stellaceae bacterium]|nr:tyrosine-type recombinase/integrase [Stellaceae bacterium]